MSLSVPTNFVPRAPVVLVKPSGVMTGYGFGAATDAARGTAIASAVSAAASGDEIRVAGNATVTANIAKNGVNWYFAPGSTITFSGAGSLFDDSSTGANGAVTTVIRGGGDFQHAAGANGYVFKATNASSVWAVECYRVTNLAAVSTTTREGIYQTGGNFYIRAQILEGACSPVYWENGNLFVEAERIESSGLQGAVYCLNTLTPTGQVWIRAKYIVKVSGVGTSGTIQMANTSTARVWIEAELIEGSNCNCVESLGGINYVTCQKLFVSGTVGSCFTIQNGGKLYLRSNKASCYGGYFGDVEAGTAFVDIDEFDDASGAGSQAIYVAGGTLYLSGKTMALATAACDAIYNTGGTVYVSGLRISTQSGCYDLNNQSGTITVAPDVVYSSSKTTGTITKDTIFGVTVTPAGTTATLFPDEQLSMFVHSFG